MLLAIAFIKADRLTTLAEDALFVDNIIYAKSSPYQRIVVTKGKTGYALFLNGNLQFNSFDEYRYHEALVHPAFAAYQGRQNACWCSAAAMAWHFARSKNISRSSSSRSSISTRT